jgi:hypothetical protein
MNGAYKKEEDHYKHEVDLNHCLKEWLIQLLREEEMKFYQSSKSDKLLQGDSNIKYFHLVAFGKHRKTHIFQLEDGGQITSEDDQLKSYTTQYYKGLFGPSESEDFSLDENRNFDIQKISTEDNEKLIDVFTEKEVKEAIFKMKHNKAPGPNDFPAEFYQNF